MSGTAQDARLTAKSFVGDTEKNGKVQKDIMSVYNKLTKRHLNCKVNAWCACFIVVVLYLCGIAKSKIYKSSGCTQQLAYYRKKKRFRPNGSTPQVGDIVFYNFKTPEGANTKKSTHVGIVTSVNYKKKGYIYVCEGNKKLANGVDGVGYRHINYKSKYIVGFGVPYYNKAA